MFCNIDVIKTDYRDIVWNVITKAGKAIDKTNGNFIIRTNNGSRFTLLFSNYIGTLKPNIVVVYYQALGFID